MTEPEKKFRDKDFRRRSKNGPAIRSPEYAQTASDLGLELYRKLERQLSRQKSVAGTSFRRRFRNTGIGPPILNVNHARFAIWSSICQLEKKSPLLPLL